MQEEDNVVTIEHIRIKAETERAWLVHAPALGHIPEWFPKSQCELDEEKKELVIPEWLAKKIGIS